MYVNYLNLNITPPPQKKNNLKHPDIEKVLSLIIFINTVYVWVILFHHYSTRVINYISI